MTSRCIPRPAMGPQRPPTRGHDAADGGVEQAVGDPLPRVVGPGRPLTHRRLLRPAPEVVKPSVQVPHSIRGEADASLPLALGCNPLGWGTVRNGDSQTDRRTRSHRWNAPLKCSSGGEGRRQGHPSPFAARCWCTGRLQACRDPATHTKLKQPRGANRRPVAGRRRQAGDRLIATAVPGLSRCGLPRIVTSSGAPSSRRKRSSSCVSCTRI
jgi:hypothetical protein